MQVAPLTKPFAWSYSRLKNFETCPKRHYHVDIKKDFKEDDSEQLMWGNHLHEAFAKRLGKKKVPFNDTMKGYEPWAEKMESIPGELSVELKFAIRADFTATEYFAKDVWFRSIADVLVVNGPVAYAGDWKTGKVLDDSQQLALMAACVFAHHPTVQAIRTEFIWLAHDCTTRTDFKRNEMARMWANIWPRISMLEQAAKTTSYPAKPSFLCRRWCPVETCPHHGE